VAGRVPVSLKSCSAGVVLSGRIPFLRGDHQRAVRKNEPDKRGEIFASVEALAKDRAHQHAWKPRTMSVMSSVWPGPIVVSDQVERPASSASANAFAERA